MLGFWAALASLKNNANADAAIGIKYIKNASKGGCFSFSAVKIITVLMRFVGVSEDTSDHF